MLIPQQRTGDSPSPPESVPSHVAPPRGRGRLTLAIWAGPPLVALALGAWRLTTPALWADELATWGAVRISWSQLRELSGTVDAVLAPYYMVMKAYTAIAGTSTAALRLPAVLAVVATTLVVVALGKRVGSAQAAVLGGLLFVVTPTVSRYGQEARPYALAMFFAALAVLVLIRAMEHPSLGRWAAYAAAIGLTGLFHPLSGLFLVVAHAAALGWLLWRKQIDGWATAMRWLAAAAAGSVPAVALLLWASDQTAQIDWIGLVSVSTLQAFAAGLFGSAAVGGVLLGLALVGVRPGPEFVCLAATAILPTALLMIIGTQEPIFVARYVLFTLPALAALASAAVMRAGPPQGIAVIAVAALLAWPVQLSFRAEDGHSQDSEEIADVIGPRYRPGDVAVFPDTHVSIPWAARDIYERYLPASRRPADVLETAPQRHDGKFLATECPDASCLGTPERVWVIRVDSPTDPLKDMSAGKRAALARNYVPVQKWQSKLLVIVLMERNSR